MGLQGPFPATLVIETEVEGWDLLESIASLQRFYKDPPPFFTPLAEAEKTAKRLGELYAKVLMACGDD